MKPQGAAQLLTASTMTGTVTSASIDIRWVDNVAFQFNFTGTPTGTFFIDGTIDNSNWNALVLTPVPVASGSAGSILINLAELGFPYIRCRYVASGGTGSLDAWINFKSLGQ
jgi:hypothetical protein